MITDKDREELIEDLRAYNDAWVLEEGKDRDRLIEFESAIRAESAEQARKDADEKLAIAVNALEAERPVSKQSDDAMELADKIRMVCFDETMGYDSFMAESLINDFAESYHQKKCAECNHEPFARFENRSGITTDVDS